MTRTKSILFLCPYPIGQSPSQRFRFEQYFSLLQEAGFRIVVKPFFSEKTWSILYHHGKYLQKMVGMSRGFISRIIVLFSISKFDFVFIHREATPVGPPFIEFVIAKILKKKIIYDFDDAIWLSNTSSENKIAACLKWHSKVKSICRWSYKISGGNDYLRDFALQFHKHVILNPTTIDAENLHNPALFKKIKESDRIIIGWTGTHSTLKYLELLEPVMKTIEEKFTNQINFLVIADKRPSLKIQSLQFLPWSKETEIEDLMKIDIGLMPLTDDLWAKGKCGFKALQYMALAIPAITTPVGVNTKIIDHGKDGYLCFTEREWETCLEKLIKDKSLREQIGRNGRKKIIKDYSVLSNSPNFLSLFS